MAGTPKSRESKAISTLLLVVRWTFNHTHRNNLVPQGEVLSKDEIQAKLTDTLRDILDDNSLMVTPQLTASQVDEWDSLNHVRLILAVERQFGIHFAAAETAGLKNVGDLIDLIQAKAGG